MKNFEQDREENTNLKIESVAQGQKLIIFAIIVNFIALSLKSGFAHFAIGVSIIATIMATIGALKIAAGLEYSIFAKAGLIVLLFVPLFGITPLISIITLLLLNWDATQSLRAAGYSVGLLGVRR